MLSGLVDMIALDLALFFLEVGFATNLPGNYGFSGLNCQRDLIIY